MQIVNICTKNFRCLEDCVLEFPSFYSAISGRNNAGKSNVLRVIRNLLAEVDTYDPFVEERSTLSQKSDYPLWKQKEQAHEDIELAMELRIDAKRDAGLFRFIREFSGIERDAGHLSVQIRRKLLAGSGTESLSISLDGEEVADEFKVQEIHKKIRSANAIYFHNSTQPRHRYYRRARYTSLFQNISPQDRAKVQADKTRLFNRLKSLAKKHKEEISDLLGRLEEKYEVSINVPTFDVEHFPFDIALATRGVDVSLEDWGSGTQNRTYILLAILQAKKVSETGSESDRVSPIIVIEEPESFLHPSAQAEFGRILRDLSHEFAVQVITTTHSPYMLSVQRPESNILLERRISRNVMRESQVVDTSSGDWKEPFALALGINDEALSPWRDVLFRDTRELLLVEGEIDKEYLEMLLDERHGEQRFNFDGEIFAYGGEGFFSNSVLLKFILNRFDKVFVTYDLDVDKKASASLEALNLVRGIDFVAVGRKESGKTDMEGLLPSRINGAVFQKNPDLVDQAVGRGDGNQDARQRLKRLKLDEFKASASIEAGDFDAFYKLCRSIEKGLAAKRG